MNKIIILRGNSGSGKTSLAKALQQKFGRNTLVISQDVVRRDMLWVHDGDGNPAISLLENMVCYGYENNPITILEGILYSETYESLFCTIKELFGDQIYAYYYDIPFQETLRRHETKPNRFDFGPKDMERWWKEKDYIGWIPEKMLNQDIALQDAVDMIYQEVCST